ncbi:zinc finger C2HC domain-containing protein 1A-like isoform X1 [Amphiura filiformis]|uniref:zinc finger C2HC domain-containing protein 1A-like isoform X1 n=1 Tax=Amphiura filiformis TaxID=82378 RepID=UPI003B21FD24
MDEYDEEPPPALNLEPCQICGRTFVPETLVKHTRICEKNSAKKRKVFDSTKQRHEGTDIASVSKSKQTKQPPSKTKKNNWRAKHEEFISNIKNARAVTVAIKTGAPLPPPPSQKRTVNPDYVQCPHCSRNFNEGAAERHIPWCKDQQNRIGNKPKTKSADREKMNIRTKYKPPLPGSKKKQTLAPTRASPGNMRQSNSASELDRQLDGLNIHDRRGRGSNARERAAGGRGVKTRSLSSDRKGGGGSKNGVNGYRNSSGEGIRRTRSQYLDDDDDEDYGYSPSSRSSSSHLSAKHRNSPGSLRTPTPPSSSRSTQNMRRQASMENVNGMKAPKYCHECGTKYPIPTAKFCCECGTKRPLTR